MQKLCDTVAIIYIVLIEMDDKQLKDQEQLPTTSAEAAATGYDIDNASPSTPIPLYYKYLLTFIFVIEEINKDQTILPNVTLGYHIYDSCTQSKKAVKSVLQILSGPGKTIPNYSCMGHRTLSGFIGDHSSLTTLPMAQILALYGYTQISYGGTSYILSDRNLYPTFYRTVQWDRASFSVISGLIELFGWTWVGVLASDDDSGNEEIQLLTEHLTSTSICVAYIIKIKPSSLDILYEKNKKRADIIRKSSAQVIILCGTYSSYLADLLAALREVINDKTLVFGPTFALNPFLLEHHMDIFNGSLVLQPSSVPMLDMSSFYDSFQTINHPEDKLLELHRYLRDEKRVDGDPVFNTNGDFVTPYIITSWKAFANKSFFLVNVGHTYKVGEKDHNISILKNKTVWKNGINKIPKSQCSENCQPGTRKVLTSALHSCCYYCVQCSEGEISNVTDSENCLKCAHHEWPNEKKTQCVPKELEFLSYTSDTIVVLILITTFVLFSLTFMILKIFILYRDTPLVKANNKNLGFLLLVSIMLSILSVFLFLGRPVDATCILRQISFGVFFSVAISCVLGKTIMVYIAFKASKPGSQWKSWISTKLSNCLVLLCSSIQVVICMSWVTVSPPFQELDTHSYKGKIIVQCNEGSLIGFYSVLGYMGILAAISFITAFLARTLPDSFNEAKYITFSMLVFCSVWIPLIPAYLSSKGKYMVAVEIFAILASCAGLLGCIYFPKCYIILWRPELNTRKHLLEKRNDHMCYS
ncbi:vomeronasal type-2 receptor 26-like [Pseudophryne corroboree]|uniref:vomeronasal type-2 receptor 26-like n=1 Tax=Pseudophryne corroboree TaxID=495146 RepID=UPI0030816A27